MYSSLGDLSHVPMDPTIKSYLAGAQKFKEGIGIEGPRPEDSKIKSISKNEMKKLNSLKNEGPKLTQTRGKLIKFNTTVSWKSVDVTPKEATKFQTLLWNDKKRGELGKVLGTNLKPKDDENLENGKVLYGAEAHAIGLQGILMKKI